MLGLAIRISPQLTEIVESHVSAVLRKLQLTDRYQLSYWANERRML